ncbi:SH2 domain-containing protein 5 isoform X2 [Bombina bombina]|nr:SH2 domain-containing protein 5 isoform X2 [Bombina bombina]
MRRKPEDQKTTCGARHRVITKFAEYVGSFPVKEVDWRRRVWIIEEQMRFLKDCCRRRAVVLKFCLQGVKMYDAQEEKLLMAHALRRIQYTTCRPEDYQFAFVSRNPHGSAHQLFCHLFVGSQPSEAQGLNLLLCRSFQLQYLTMHPEAADPEVPMQGITAKPQRKCAGAAVARKPLDPEEVSQSVNALVSFRRVPASSEDGLSNNQMEDSDNLSIPRKQLLGNPYCSPTLVRKKAIRSKVLRSGAYRCPNYEAQLQKALDETNKTDPQTHIAAVELSERLELLLNTVWFYAGIGRDFGLTLLKEDRVGAFLFCADAGCEGQWTLFMRTQCGVIPYKVHRTQEGRYCFEHLPEEFASLASLVEHHTNAESCPFYQLAHGRVNPCYEELEPSTNSKSEPAFCPGQHESNVNLGEAFHVEEYVAD